MAFIFGVPRSVRLLIFASYVAAGIVLSFQFPDLPILVIKGAFAIAFVTAIVSYSRKTKIRTLLFQISVAMCAISIGAFCLSVERSPTLPARLLGKNQFQMIVLESPAASEKSIRMKCRLKTIILNDSLYPVDQKIISYIFGQSEPIKKLLPGDQILGKGLIKEIVSSGNPGSFDVKSFYRHQNIQYAVYLNSVYSTGNYNQGFILRRYAHIWKNFLSRLLSSCSEDPEVRALTQAILLGDKSELTPELKHTFSSTGTAHVLAVSGLHIGIIYAILLPIIGSVKKGSRRLRYSRLFLFLLALWIYAMITGLSPSICRAACMVSMLLVGNMMKRSISKWNILGFSALVLLVIQPFAIYQPGFQLSYAALIGIFIFYLPLVRSFAIPGVIPQYLWKMSCVSIAAQVTVMPIAIFYFHEVSLLFIFAGWVAVPATTLLLISGIIFIFCRACIPFVSEFLGSGITKFSQLLIRLLSSMESQTQFHLEQLFLSFENALAIYLSLIFFLGYRFKKKRVYLFLSAISMICFAVHSISDLNSAKHRQDFVIHSSPIPRLDLNVGDTTFSFIGVQTQKALDSISNRKEGQSTEILQSIKLDTLTYQSTAFLKHHNIIFTSDLDILILNKTNPVIPAILSNHDKKRILWCLFVDEHLFDQHSISHFDQIVIDRSVPYYKEKDLARFCKTHHIPVHDMREQGAFNHLLNEKK